MSHIDVTLSDPPRRAGANRFFFFALGTIGGTYVLLILMLLGADVVYLFSDRSSEEVVVDFSVDANRTRIQGGESPSDRFAKYGLSFASAADERSLTFLDSSDPGAFEAFGTPHEDFGGTGRGAGGRRGEQTENDRPLGNVLLLTEDNAPSGGTITLNWKQPVELDRLTILNARQGASLRAFSSDGKLAIERELATTGPSSVLSVHLGIKNISRLDVALPDGGALADVAFFWNGRLLADWEAAHPILAAVAYNPITNALAKPEIQHSIYLSLVSCTITTILSLWTAVPLGYLLSRHRFFGRDFIDAVLDIPIVLPPLVVGLSLLILFQFFPATLREAVIYKVPAVILAQYAVACAFAVRTMRATFDQIDSRREMVALTLGCSRASAFMHIVLPECRRGMLTAGTLAWARALGEFGPLLIFAGATRNKTEVLSTTVFLELSVGDLGAAVAVSMIMVVSAIIVLVLARLWGTRTLSI